MNLSKTLTTFSFATALIAFAPPAFAQHHGGGGGHGGGAAVSRGGGGGAARAAAPRAGSGGVVRGSAVGRPYAGGVRSGYYRGGVGRYAGIAPIRFYRPYYSFRPRFSLGFGLWAGYPFAYGYPFYDPFYGYYGGYYGYNGYNNPYPYGGGVAVGPNGYPPYGAQGYPPASGNAPAGNYPSGPTGQAPEASLGVQSGQANTGGVSFDITPNNAQLFVDGALTGTVGQFTPTSQPLGLTAGRHKIEIRANGYQTMSFDVDIITGQVIPYQGTMER